MNGVTYAPSRLKFAEEKPIKAPQGVAYASLP